MNDFVYIPKSIAYALFDEVLPWEYAQSLVTLLTIPTQREPTETTNTFSRYIVNWSNIAERVETDIDYSRFVFKSGTSQLPFISDFMVSQGKFKKVSFWVHRLCNPVMFSRRHCLDKELMVYPPPIWKIPRHTLIRWRYSCRLPIHKTNFARRISTDFEFPKGNAIPSPQTLFKRISDVFFSLTRQVDESSLSYSFLCYFYYYIHDKLITAIQNRSVSPKFQVFLWKFWEILLVEANASDYPPRRLFRIEGRLRDILPNDFFTKHPFSLFSYQNITKEERLKI